MHLSASQSCRREGENKDRGVGRVHFPICRLGQKIGRKVGLGCIDRGLHVLGGAVDVPVEPELKDDERLTGLALRGHLGHVGDLSEMPFERGRETGRDHVGARAWQLRGDRDRRKIDLRKRCNRQSLVAEHAGERDCNGEERRRDGPGDERRRNVHGSRAPGIASLGGRGAGFLARAAAEDASPDAVDREVDDRRRVKASGAG
jgi:hypothetical protein